MGPALPWQPFAFDLAPRTGLTVQVAGVPIVRGSWFQYYEPDWSKGYYTSLYNDPKIERSEDGSIKMVFRSGDGRAFGTQKVSRTDAGLRVDCEFGWRGKDPIRVEVCAANIWVAPVASGRLFLDGALAARDFGAKSYPETATPADRAFGPPALASRFQAPLGEFEVKSGQKLTLFDARGYDQPWALDRDLLWLGALALEVKPDSVTRFSYEIAANPSPIAETTRRISTRAQNVPDLVLPHSNHFPLIPSPKQMTSDPGPGFVLSHENIVIDVPHGLEFNGREFLDTLKRTFEIPNCKVSFSRDARIILRVEPGRFPPEGYELRSSPNTVVVLGADYDGLRNGLQTLAQLVRWQNGQLVVPATTIRDWPSVRWRGVHIFGGPQIVQHQTVLAERVIAPLKFNGVVVQCERTKWKSFPKMHTELCTSREDLKKTFDLYRLLGIEPIPLVQSLGHMEWFFANDNLKELAINPEIPYTIDYRKPEAVAAMNTLWKEIVELLEPETVHFGCDEIDMRGMPDDPELTTQVWSATMPYLARIASRHQVRGMIWGDKCLAPGQAIDAALGDDFSQAKRRRDAIPKSFWVADWHYKNDPKSDRFMWSLNTFKSSDLWPIASTWFNSANIRGFSQAAYRAGAGLLQTTWAGHQHDEENVLREYRQFSAYVLAAEYAWSGRKDSLDKLGWDPGEVFAHMYFGEPSPMGPVSGCVTDGIRAVRVDGIQLRTGPTQQLLSNLSSATASDPTTLEIAVEDLIGKTLVIALDTSQVCWDRDLVGVVEIHGPNGMLATRTLRYGSDVRAPRDARAIPRGLRANGTGAIRIRLPERSKVQKIILRSASSFAGLRFNGVSAY